MGPIEPHADVRMLAAGHRQLYVGWVQAGFTEAQAMELLGRVVTAQTAAMQAAAREEDEK